VISAFQRADPARVLPRLLHAALPALLAAAKSPSAGRPDGGADRGWSATLRAAALQGLFVGTFRLPFPATSLPATGHLSSSSNGSVACPPLARALVSRSAFVASVLATALAALAPPPLVAPLAAPAPTPGAAAAAQAAAAPAPSSAVECAALKLLMALVARAPGLFDAAPARGSGGPSAALVRAVTLPSPSSLLAPRGQAAAASVEYPGVDGPRALAQCRAAVRACAVRCQDPTARQLAAQLTEALAV
jgi:hypothetical protein